MVILKSLIHHLFCIQTCFAHTHDHHSHANKTCHRIARRISRDSEVIYPGTDPRFAKDIEHYFSSSTQVFEAGNTEDVSIAIRHIGYTRTPFAVQSVGGHATNQGFSSTTGVHISMVRLNEVTLSAHKAVARIGTGQGWVDVYKKLDETGVNVPGGRVEGPGVGGFVTGGGYAWRTNSYGLTVDDIKSYTVVLPNGIISTASSTSNADLFFALKGGLNRFGVVTDVEMSTYPQIPLVFGGVRVYPPNETDAILNATAAFESINKDPLATIITVITGPTGGSSTTVVFFYDGPTKPASFSVFDGIIPTLDLVKTQSYSDFVSGIITDGRRPLNTRGGFHTFSTTRNTLRFLRAMKQECDTLIKIGAGHGLNSVNYDVDVYLPGAYGQHATDSAYPHADSPLAFLLDVAWQSPSEDEFWHAAIQASLDRLKRVAMSEGIYQDIDYPNYAAAGSTPRWLYGSNAERLRRIRNKVDPKRVMELTGGFDI